jgi:hypothetical protein
MWCHRVAVQDVSAKGAVSGEMRMCRPLAMSSLHRVRVTKRLSVVHRVRLVSLRIRGQMLQQLLVLWGAKIRVALSPRQSLRARLSSVAVDFFINK